LQPRDLISLARDLAGLHKGKPSQAALRRALSTAYYAMFHTLAKSGADLMLGGTGADRSKHAWRQVYRALEHGVAKDACRNGAFMSKFPKDIEDFGNMFVALQEKRHNADYDPEERFYRSSVIQDINAAEHAIAKYEKTAIKDRRAFTAYVLFKRRNW